MKPVTMYANDQPERLATMLLAWPAITAGNGKRLLYVGAMPTRHDFVDLLLLWGWRVTIMEAYEPYANELCRIDGIEDVVTADIRTADTNGYDCLFWWHGPEHVSKSQAAEVFKAARCAVVLGMPHGDTPSGTTDGNAYNAHVSAWTPLDFGKEWTVRATGTHITAARRARFP